MVQSNNYKLYIFLEPDWYIGKADILDRYIGRTDILDQYKYISLIEYQH